jgi:hypothetical protein
MRREREREHAPHNDDGRFAHTTTTLTDGQLGVGEAPDVAADRCGPEAAQECGQEEQPHACCFWMCGDVGIVNGFVLHGEMETSNIN